MRSDVFAWVGGAGLWLSRKGFLMQTRRGFTLIEVLVVVAIIALLISILIPSLNRSREQARRMACAGNEHQIMLAALMYAERDRDGIYIYREGNGGGDGMRLLYPRYLRDFRVVVCPSTTNVVRRPDDLLDNADSADDSTGGHSYEMRTWMWTAYNFNGFKPKPEPFYNPTTSKWETREPIKSLKNVKRPYGMLLFGDADDDPPANKPDGINNWPDAYNNHGADGANIAYCDGHAEFNRTGRKLMLSFLTGYYYPSLPSALAQSIYAKCNVQYNSSTQTFKW